MEKKKNEEIVEVLCKKFIEASVEAIKLFHVVRIRTLEKYLFTHKERQRQRHIRHIGAKIPKMDNRTGNITLEVES